MHFPVNFHMFFLFFFCRVLTVQGKETFKNVFHFRWFWHLLCFDVIPKWKIDFILCNNTNNTGKKRGILKLIFMLMLMLIADYGNNAKFIVLKVNVIGNRWFPPTNFYSIQVSFFFSVVVGIYYFIFFLSFHFNVSGHIRRRTN